MKTCSNKIERSLILILSIISLLSIIIKRASAEWSNEINRGQSQESEESNYLWNIDLKENLIKYEF